MGPRAHLEAIKGFIRGYLDGLAWTLDPANRTEAAGVLVANMAEIKPHMADAVMTSLLSPRSGLTPRGEMIMDGVRAVLDLRSRFGGGPITTHDKFIDLSYYGAAINPL